MDKFRGTDGVQKFLNHKCSLLIKREGNKIVWVDYPNEIKVAR